MWCWPAKLEVGSVRRFHSLGDGCQLPTVKLWSRRPASSWSCRVLWVWVLSPLAFLRGFPSKRPCLGLSFFKNTGCEDCQQHQQWKHCYAFLKQHLHSNKGSETSLKKQSQETAKNDTAWELCQVKRFSICVALPNKASLSHLMGIKIPSCRGGCSEQSTGKRLPQLGACLFIGWLCLFLFLFSWLFMSSSPSSSGFLFLRFLRFSISLKKSPSLSLSLCYLFLWFYPHKGSIRGVPGAHLAPGNRQCYLVSFRVFCSVWLEESEHKSVWRSGGVVLTKGFIRCSLASKRGGLRWAPDQRTLGSRAFWARHV